MQAHGIFFDVIYSTVKRDCTNTKNNAHMLLLQLDFFLVVFQVFGLVGKESLQGLVSTGAEGDIVCIHSGPFPVSFV